MGCGKPQEVYTVTSALPPVESTSKLPPKQEVKSVTDVSKEIEALEKEVNADKEADIASETPVNAQSMYTKAFYKN